MGDLDELDRRGVPDAYSGGRGDSGSGTQAGVRRGVRRRRAVRARRRVSTACCAPRPGWRAARSARPRASHPTRPAGTAAAVRVPRSRSRCSATPRAAGYGVERVVETHRRPAGQRHRREGRPPRAPAVLRLRRRPVVRPGRPDRPGAADRAPGRRGPGRRQRRHPQRAAVPVGAAPLRGRTPPARRRRRGRGRHLPRPRHRQADRRRRSSRSAAPGRTDWPPPRRSRWSRRAAGRSRSASILGPEFEAAPAILFGPDRFHPSAEGYRRLVDVLLPSTLAALGFAPDDEAEPEAYRGEGVLPVTTAAVQAVKTPGTEVDGTEVGGARRGVRGLWVELRHRRRTPDRPPPRARPTRRTRSRSRPSLRPVTGPDGSIFRPFLRHSGAPLLTVVRATSAPTWLSPPQSPAHPSAFISRKACPPHVDPHLGVSLPCAHCASRPRSSPPWPACSRSSLGASQASGAEAARPAARQHPSRDRRPAARPPARRRSRLEQCRPLDRDGQAAAAGRPAAWSSCSAGPASHWHTIGVRKLRRGKASFPVVDRPVAPAYRAIVPSHGRTARRSAASTSPTTGDAPDFVDEFDGVGARSRLGAPHPVLQPLGRPGVLQGLTRRGLRRRRRAAAQLDAGPARRTSSARSRTAAGDRSATSPTGSTATSPPSTAPTSCTAWPPPGCGSPASWASTPPSGSSRGGCSSTSPRPGAPRSTSWSGTAPGAAGSGWPAPSTRRCPTAASARSAARSPIPTATWPPARTPGGTASTSSRWSGPRSEYIFRIDGHEVWRTRDGRLPRARVPDPQHAVQRLRAAVGRRRPDAAHGRGRLGGLLAGVADGRRTMPRGRRSKTSGLPGISWCCHSWLKNARMRSRLV